MEVNFIDVFAQLDVFSKKSKKKKKSNRQFWTILLLALLFKAWFLNTAPMTNFHVNVRSDSLQKGRHRELDKKGN